MTRLEIIIPNLGSANVLSDGCPLTAMLRPNKNHGECNKLMNSLLSMIRWLSKPLLVRSLSSSSIGLLSYF
jgi:hypothetical protein